MVGLEERRLSLVDSAVQSVHLGRLRVIAERAPESLIRRVNFIVHLQKIIVVEFRSIGRGKNCRPARTENFELLKTWGKVIRRSDVREGAVR
jgi:hypothetical protein